MENVYHTATSRSRVFAKHISCKLLCGLRYRVGVGVGVRVTEANIHDSFSNQVQKRGLMDLADGAE